MILVSAQGPNLSIFFFGGTFIRLGGLFGQGLGLGLGPGLDNYFGKRTNADNSVGPDMMPMPFTLNSLSRMYT